MEGSVIIVNRFWLKIIACMVLVFGVVVLGYVFWPQGNGQAASPAEKDSQNPARLTTPATDTASPAAPAPSWPSERTIR